MDGSLFKKYTKQMEGITSLRKGVEVYLEKEHGIKVRKEQLQIEKQKITITLTSSQKIKMILNKTPFIFEGKELEIIVK